MLFNKKLLQSYLNNFALPKDYDFARAQNIISKWQEAVRNGNYDRTKEEQVQSTFLTRFFGIILGYSEIHDSPNEWYLINEAKTEIDGTKADGALGYFSKTKNITRAVIELKDANTSLDKKQSTRKDYDSPVSQAFSYSSKFDRCDWIIVSNFKEIRLYNKDRGQGYYESFEILKLDDEKEFKRFYFCLSKQNLLDENRNSLLDRLVKDTSKNEEEITKDFYKDYKNLRKFLFEHICEHNPNIDKKCLLEKTQKLLDRLIFVMFCEDSNISLLPPYTLKKYYKMRKNLPIVNDDETWEIIKGLFKSIDKGNSKVEPPINRYNGGLFAYDEILDNIKIKDSAWEKVIKLANYDFESDLNVNILGHIFEQSLNDLEQIKAEIDGIEQNKQKSKRKKDGIFYTPEYITRYIVEQTIGAYLEENPDKLETIKILDPACGSGAFLNQAHTFLQKQYKIRTEEKINSETSLKRGGVEFLQTNLLRHQNMAEVDRSILLNNIYGVDLNSESTEITKLALWLKTAKKDEPLQNLDANIKCGNSLIDDQNVAGNKAFNWNEEFKDIMDNGGFDIIIGNPPYVNISNINNKNYRKFLQKKFNDSAIKRFDLYALFIDLSLSLLKQDGYLSFIIPYSFLSQDYAELLRKKILSKYSIRKILNLSAVKVFDDAEVKTIVFVIQNKKTDNFCKISNILTKDDFLAPLNYEEIDTSTWLKTENSQFRLKYTDKIQDIICKIKNINLTFGDLFYISKGASLHNEKLKKKGREYIFDKMDYNLKPFLQGKDCVSRYTITKTKGLMYSPNEHYRPMFRELFENEKLVIYKVTGDKGLIVCYDNNNHYTNDSLYCAVPYKFLVNIKLPKTKLKEQNILLSQKTNTKFTLTIINSKLINFYFKNVFGYELNVYPDDIKRLPIAQATEEQQNNLAQKAEQMIELNKQLHNGIDSAIELIKAEYQPKTISKNLEKFYTLGVHPFIEELEKQKVKLSLSQKEELIAWYKEKSEKLNQIQSEIDKLDKTIDQEVYKLYGLTDDEIKIVEGN